LPLLPDSLPGTLRDELKRTDEHLMPLAFAGGPDAGWMPVDARPPARLSALRRDALAAGARRCGKMAVWWRRFGERLRG